MRLRAHLGASRPMGVLLLKTALVDTKDGEPVYRLVDRMNLDLPGLGSARLRVEADVRADFSAVSVTLESEESRGPGVLSHQLIRLERDGEGWVRSVSVNRGQPTRERVELPERLIVLTPPLGVGERLTRLVSPTVGERTKLPAYDLETGLAASWQAHVVESAQLQLQGEPEVAGLRLERREGAARLIAFRPQAGGSAPLRMISAQKDALIAFQSQALVQASSAAQRAPAARVVAFLRAVARADSDAVRRCLDLDALYAAAGGAADDAKLRADFEAVLLERLTDVDWLESTGLLLVADAVTADAFSVEVSGDVARVSPRGKAPAFRLEQTAGAWRIVELPK